LLNLGYDVRGSDAHPTPLTARLQALGATFHAGHDAAHLGDADVVVVSSAVRRDNPEVLEARRRGVILRPLGDVIVLMPPLSMSVEELTHLLDAAYLAIEKVTQKRDTILNSANELSMMSP